MISGLCLQTLIKMFCPQPVLCRPMSEVTECLPLLFTDYVTSGSFPPLTVGGSVTWPHRWWGVREAWREKCSLGASPDTGKVVMQGPRPHPCICVRLLKCTQEWVFWTLFSSQLCLGRFFCFINQIFFHTPLSILISEHTHLHSHSNSSIFWKTQ